MADTQKPKRRAQSEIGPTTYGEGSPPERPADSNAPSPAAPEEAQSDDDEPEIAPARAKSKPKK